MARPISMTLTLACDAEVVAAMSASLTSIVAALWASDRASEHLSRFFDQRGVTVDQSIDLIGGELIDFTASRAGELHALQIAPGQRYFELLAALADELDPHSIRFAHGWPILSFDALTPSNVAGRGGDASASPEGVA